MMNSVPHAMYTSLNSQTTITSNAPDVALIVAPTPAEARVQQAAERARKWDRMLQGCVCLGVVVTVATGVVSKHTTGDTALALKVVSLVFGIPTLCCLSFARGC